MYTACVYNKQRYTFVCCLLQIGGLNGVIALDCGETHMKTSGADEAAIKSYTETTLPVLAYFEDMRILDVVRSHYNIH